MSTGIDKFKHSTRAVYNRTCTHIRLPVSRSLVLRSEVSMSRTPALDKRYDTHTNTGDDSLDVPGTLT